MRQKLSFLIFIFTFSVNGQNKQLIYNFDDLPQSLLTNPGAETNFDMHIGFPLLSQISFSVGSSGVNMHDIFKDDGSNINTRIKDKLHEMTRRSSGVNMHDIFKDDGSNINTRIKDKLHEMTRNDFFSVNQQLEILSLGWRDSKKRYFTAGIYQELDAFIYFPKDIAVLAYEGNKNYMGQNFDFSDVAFTSEILNVFHIGITNYFTENFKYGVRAKIYSGVFNAHSLGNRGIFRTEVTQDGSNIYQHFVSDVDILINTSGWTDLRDADDSTGLETGQNLLKKAFLGGNLGMGFDVGFTWFPSEQYRVTGSILDVGFVRQTKNVENYRYYGDYETSGIELLFPPSSSPNYWNEWEKNLEANLRDQTLENSYLTWRPVKINASVDFGWFENTEPCNCYRPPGRRRYYNYAGMHFFAINRPRGFNYATTLYYDRFITDVFRAKVSYTADSFSFTNIGLLASARFHNFNVYLAADNILDYFNLAKARNASLQLGLQLIFNRE